MSIQGSSDVLRHAQDYKTQQSLEFASLYNANYARMAQLAQQALHDSQIEQSNSPRQRLQFDSLHRSQCPRMPAHEQGRYNSAKCDLEAVQLGNKAKARLRKKGLQQRSAFELLYGDHCAQTAAQEQQKFDLITVQSQGVGSAAAAITGGVAKVALGTAKLAGKTALLTAKTMGKIAVVTGKTAVKATVAVEKAAQKSVVAAAKATQKSAVTAAKATQKSAVTAAKAAKKGAVAAEKKAIKAFQARAQGKSHGDTDPQDNRDLVDLAEIVNTANIKNLECLRNR